MKRTLAVLLAAGLVTVASAAILPGNVLANADAEAASGDPFFPADWFHGPLGAVVWSEEQAVSPTHSLKMVGDLGGFSAEWRSRGVDVTPDITDVTIQASLLYESIVFDASASSGVFIAYFDGPVDSFGNTTGGFLGQSYFPINEGDSGGWLTVNDTFALPAGTMSFDVRPRLWFTAGNLYADDISAVLIPEPATGLLVVLCGLAALRRR